MPTGLATTSNAETHPFTAAARARGQGASDAAATVVQRADGSASVRTPRCYSVRRVETMHYTAFVDSADGVRIAVYE